MSGNGAASRKRVLVIDYGMGNLNSVVNALATLGYAARTSERKEDIANADAYVLPGVGAFGEAMKNLQRLDIVGLLAEQVLERRKPFLGICLGMQLMAEDSEELGFHKGLGWIRGHVLRIDQRDGIRLPHVGWNNVDVRGKQPLFENIATGSNYYFDHTYRLECDPSNVLATCRYGSDIVAAVRHENIFATQFHPEKSQVKGLKLLRNFLNYAEAGQS